MFCSVPKVLNKTVCLLFFTCKSLPRCQTVSTDHLLKDTSKVKQRKNVYYIDMWYTRALHPSVQSVLYVTLNCSHRHRYYMKVFRA